MSLGWDHANEFQADWEAHNFLRFHAENKCLERRMGTHCWPRRRKHRPAPGCWKNGLQRGDIILSVNRKKTRSIRKFDEDPALD